MSIKKIGAEAIIIAISAPMIAWVISFVISSYSSMADVSNLKDDVRAIRQDTSYIKNYLLEHK